MTLVILSFMFIDLFVVRGNKSGDSKVKPANFEPFFLKRCVDCQT